MDERKQESWHLNGKENNDGEGREKVVWEKVEEEDKKVWKAHINEDNHRWEKAKW